MTGREEPEAGRVARDLTARIRGARGILERTPAHAELDAAAAALHRLEQQLDACWTQWERDRAVARIAASWAATEREIAGWRDEAETMTWAELTHELGLPQTMRAVRACAAWQEDSLIAEAKAQHAGDPAVRDVVDDTPLAGNFAPGIGAAMAEASRRTRQPISQHIEWDVIAVVEGPGTVKVRTERELLIKETSAKMTLESWEPEAATRIQIIALHAGPVAISVA